MLFQADVDVHAVDPQVHVVHIGQVPGSEGALLGPPGLGQLGDHRAGQARGGAEELPQRGPEVTRGHPVQVQQRQHLIDLRSLATPRRQDRRGELRPLPGVGVDAAVVDPRRDHPHRARAGEDVAGLMAAVAHHQPAAPLVALGAEPGDVGINLGLQGLGQHPPRALPHDVVDHRRRLTQLDAASAVIAHHRLGDYREHGSYLPDRRSSAGLCLRTCSG